jgi:putative transposase
MGSKSFSQAEKLAVLQSIVKVGIKEAARLSGVHFTTVYDWKNLHARLGEQGFLEYKPSYNGRGIKEITEEQERHVVDCWKINPGYGPGQVRGQLRRQGITISIKTIRKIMKASGYKAAGKKSRTMAVTRFEASRPLELTQMDILEFFINKVKIYVMLLLDDYSRFILGFRLLDDTSTDDVIKLVSESVNRYGKMEEILTDRGFVFYSWRGINRFEKYLEQESIDHTHARPHHPQTLGKVEACNRRIKNELLSQHHFANLHEVQAAMEAWVENYNYRRPHQGIGGFLVPAERFHGQAKQALKDIDRGINIADDNKQLSTGIERSIINLVTGQDGKMVLYILGHPLTIGGSNG